MKDVKFLVAESHERAMLIKRTLGLGEEWIALCYDGAMTGYRAELIVLFGPTQHYIATRSSPELLRAEDWVKKYLPTKLAPGGKMVHL